MAISRTNKFTIPTTSINCQVKEQRIESQSYLSQSTPSVSLNQSTPSVSLSQSTPSVSLSQSTPSVSLTIVAIKTQQSYLNKISNYITRIKIMFKSNIKTTYLNPLSY